MSIIDELDALLVEEFQRRGLYTLIAMISLTPVSGCWKSKDVYRWEGSARAESIPPNWNAKPRVISIVSWETMTNVVRAHRRFLRGNGEPIDITTDDHYHFEVSPPVSSMK